MQNREYEELKSIMEQFTPFQDTDFIKMTRYLEKCGYQYTVEQLAQLIDKWCANGWLRCESGLVDRYHLVQGIS